MADVVRFQHFEVLRKDDGSLFELGRGAMGITYKAFDTNLRCDVALKVINARYLDSDIARQRFLREARSAAALRHPNVATVFHLGNEDDQYFYAMEFVDGETVEGFMKREGAVPTSMALEIASQVARALGAAQKQSLVHRDLKPSNLMLVTDDVDFTVKVIDFGLAKSSSSNEDAATLTVAGFLGTPHFASPEQLDEREVDLRSDIYSLGVTLWFMLAGRTPFSGSLAQVMSQHLHREPPFESLDGQSPEMIALLRRMMAKDPADRPQTPADLRQEIENVRAASECHSPATPVVRSPPEAFETAGFFATVAEPPVPPPPSTPPPLPPPSPASPGAPPSRKMPILLGSAALLVILGALGAWQGAAFFQKSRTDPPPIPTPTPAPTVVATTTPEPTASPTPTPPPETDSREKEYAATLDVAQHLQQQGNTAGALEMYAVLAEKFPDEKAPRTSMENLAANLRTRAGSIPSAEWSTIRLPLEHAAALNVRSAQMLLGEQLLETNPTASLKWLLDAAGQGQTEAMVTAGQMLASGKGTAAPDLPAAVKWFTQAAEAGSADGMYLLAECLLEGNGIPPDPARAVELLTAGTELGNVRATNSLGNIFRKGIPGVIEPDFAESFRYFSRAAGMGFLDAQGNLGVLYITGEGTEKDPVKAAGLFRDGAEKGNASCMYYLAMCLDGGVGMEKDSATAKEWFVKAAQAGDQRAAVWCEENNVSVTPAPPEAN